jgi:hypothetical protein
LLGYELIESSPDFGFQAKQLVAMKVYKVGKNKIVDIIPITPSTNSAASSNYQAIRSISAFLPENRKFGNIQGAALA